MSRTNIIMITLVVVVLIAALLYVFYGQSNDLVDEKEEKEVYFENIRVALSLEGSSLSNNLSQRFARAPYFLIVDVKDGEIASVKVWENIMLDAEDVGIAVATELAEKQIAAVIGTNPGPRLFDTFQDYAIPIYIGEGTGEEALASFLANELEIFIFPR